MTSIKLYTRFTTSSGWLQELTTKFHSQESQPATATAVQDCFLAAKPLLFLPNLCVKDQLSTTVTRDKREQCAHNFAAARCGDLLGNKLATIQLYNECRDVLQ